MGGITPAWKGEVWLADLGIRLPAQKGTRLDAPEGFRGEGLMSNAVVPVNFVPGLQWPTLSIPLTVTSNWFYPALLDTLLGVPTRLEPVLAGQGGWYGVARDLVSADLADIGAIWFWNGANAWQLNGCKCCLFTLANPGMGGYLRSQLVFWGASIAAIGWSQALSPFLLHSARSQNCAHSLPVNPTEWTLTVRNPLRPNAKLSPIPPPGDFRFYAPEEHNSGALSVEFDALFQAHRQWGGVADGVNFYLKVVPPGGVSVGMNVTNPLWSKRYSAEFGTGRQKAPLACVGRGNASALSPLVIL